MNREEAREYFKNSGLTYENITVTNIDRLELLIEKEIMDYAFDKKILPTMRFQQIKVRNRKRTLEFLKNNKGLKYYQSYIKSHYFHDRECITFQENGFIGFAGEMDGCNVTPIINAFIKLVDEMKKIKESEELDK